ncbi:MAG: SDR family oxidoreductase [Lapillicoccus sp.]
MTPTSPTAVVTGASAGLGRALATALARRGWTLVLDARGADRLAEVATELSRLTTVEAVSGSVTDPAHRAEVAAAVRRHGPLDLLVHNASELGGSPQPRLRDLDPHTLQSVLDTNVVAPLALTRELLPELEAAGGTVLAISSDAAVEHYEGWGAYGGSKAALDHVMGTFAAELPALRWYAVDPGDMRTAMHQAAFPGEDISDRPLPETVVPALLRFLDQKPESGRYRASDFAVREVVA